MPLHHITHLRLFCELQERGKCDPLSLELAGQLLTLTSVASPLLEFIRASFPAYPNHGLDHSLRIVLRIGQILDRDALKGLTSLEIFAFIVAALLHDIGMVAPDATAPNDPSVRESHHLRSAHFAIAFLNRHMPPDLFPRLAQVVAFIVEAHGLDWDIMASRPEYLQTETVGASYIRTRIIAVLLRVGDLLDCDADRTSALCCAFYRDWITRNKSTAHHERHRMLEHFHCDAKSIEIRVKCADKQHYQLWSTWLHYLVRDIEKANTYLFRDDLALFQLPRPVVSVVPNTGAPFNVWNLRFEIDPNGMLWDVLRQSVYTDRMDFIRELLSNAIDAGLRRVFDAPGALPSEAPLLWRTDDYVPMVLMVYDPSTREITIRDNGVGMNAGDLQSFLFKVAGRGVSPRSAERGFAPPTIGAFGVGFISVLSRAANVKIVTHKWTAPEERLIVELDSNLRDACVEQCQSRGAGTSISLRLKESESANMPQYSQWVERTFAFPGVSIACVDLGRVRELTSLLSELDRALREAGQAIGSLAVGADATLTLLTDDAQDCRRAIEAVRAFDNHVRRTYSRVRQGKLLRLSEWQPAPSTLFIDAFRRVPLPDVADVRVVTFAATNHIKRVLDGRRAKPAVERSMGIIVIPIVITDAKLGIEWRSLHGFIFSKCALCSEVAFDARIGALRIHKRKTHFLDTPYEEIVDDIQDAVVEEGGWVTYFSDRYDAHVVSDALKRYELRYTALCMHDGCIGFYNVSGERRKAADSGRELLGSNYVDWLLALQSKTGSKRRKKRSRRMIKALEGMQEKWDDIGKWFNRASRDPNRMDVFQDGLKSPLTMRDLLPIGQVSGVANFTGRSRFQLNISRNAVYTTGTVLSEWRSLVGDRILRAAKRALEDGFGKVGIKEWKYEDVWQPNDSGNEIIGFADWSRVCDPDV